MHQIDGLEGKVSCGLNKGPTTNSKPKPRRLSSSKKSTPMAEVWDTWTPITHKNPVVVPAPSTPKPKALRLDRGPQQLYDCREQLPSTEPLRMPGKKSSTRSKRDYSAWLGKSQTPVPTPSIPSGLLMSADRARASQRASLTSSPTANTNSLCISPGQ